MSRLFKSLVCVASIVLALLLMLPASSSGGAIRALSVPHLGYGLNEPNYAALRDMPRRSAWTGTTMMVTPDRLSFVGARDNPRTLTATVSVGHMGTPFTWTVRLDPSAPTGLRVSPISGTTPSTLTVSVDAGLFATGTVILPATFTYTLRLTADPTTTVGSPFTLPVTVRVLDHLPRTFLPIVQRDAGASPTPTPTPPPGVITPTSHFGAVFITSAEAPADESRYQRALATGAGMDRWPLYWPGVEPSEGTFVWTGSSHQVDRAVISDTEHGIQPLIILMNTPDFYATGGNPALPMPRVGQSLEMYSKIEQHGVSSVSSAGSAPVRLFEPVFSDGTDTPGITKTINTNNPWARFVYESVNRYKPGGVLAQQLGWPASRGVRHWEIWNEEDYAGFWIGTVEEYARLLKVAYLAAKLADPQAKIIYGGLSNINPSSTWLQDTLAVINTYPDKEANGWFFDAVAEHNYVNSWNTFNYLFRATQALKTYTITNKSLWVTESNVWLCDDGNITPPCLHEDGTPVELRANLDEQAAFVVQSAAYATWMNVVAPVEAIFHLQMYDDCADPIAGTTWGGGLGLVRNPTGWGCFQAYLPDTPRPAYTAFQKTIANLRDAVPKWRVRPGRVPTDTVRAGQGAEVFSFYRSPAQERVLAMWARGYVTETVVLTATSASARLVWLNSTQIISPTNGVYTVTLPAATNHAQGTTDGSGPIGGRPYFLVEPDASGTGGLKP
jgi:hypothetical protein